VSFRINEEIDVTLIDGGARYEAGPFRSIAFANEDALAKSIAGRFPKAKVDGKPIAERFPVLKSIEPGTLAPPAPLPMVTEEFRREEAVSELSEKLSEGPAFSAVSKKTRKAKAAKPKAGEQQPLWP
jgi:hypothetical protein